MLHLRSRAFPPFLLLSLAAATSSTASPDEFIAALRAPVMCSGLPSCGSSLTLSEAKESFAKKGKSLLGVRQHQKKSKGVKVRPESGAAAASKVDSQVTERADERALALPRPNYGPVVDGHVCGSPEAIGYYYFWAPVNQIPGGQSALEGVEEAVRSGVAKNSHIYVEESQSTPSERYMALCAVSVVKGQVGLPRACTTVAIVAENEAWLRVGNLAQRDCLMMATFRPSGAISVRFDVKTARGPQSLLKSILRTLQDDLALEVESSVNKSTEGKITSIDLRSTSGMRDSRVLPPGWRDTLDFDVSIHQGEGQLEVSGTAHTMVSRQAVGRFTDYVGLDDSQRSLYAKGLDSAMETAIKRSCTTFTKLDSKSLVCN